MRADRRLGVSSVGRGVVVGVAVLLVVAAIYPVVAASTGRPLAVFALPPLLTAIVAGWRPTVVVGVLSVVVAAAIGMYGPLNGPALTARLLIIVSAVAAGAIGSWIRERQQEQLREAEEATALLRAFEHGLAPSIDAPRGFEVSMRYAASGRAMDLGGDFVDAIALDDDRLAFVIGDVCGHGPQQAALGTTLRMAWRVIAAAGTSDPLRWVRRLDELFVPTGRGTYATLCTGLVDQRTGLASLVSAGHPWPIVVGSTATIVAMRPGSPIGLGMRDWSASELDLGGQRLLLYTDGLVENPSDVGPPERWGEEGLLRVLQQQPAAVDVDLLSDGLMRDAMAGRDVRDDIAILVIAFDARSRRAARRDHDRRRPALASPPTTSHR